VALPGLVAATRPTEPPGASAGAERPTKPGRPTSRTAIRRREITKTDDTNGQAAGTTSGGRRADRWEPRLARFQGRVVRGLLKHLGLEGREKDLRRHCEERTGRPWLLFATFHQFYPTFPVWLCTWQLLYLHEMSAWELLSEPLRPRGRLFRAFDYLADEVPAGWLDAGRPYGVVFEVLKVKARGPLWVMHNDRELSLRADNRFLSGDGEAYGVQPLGKFLDALGWKP
jgi:hypothetical protein